MSKRLKRPLLSCGLLLTGFLSLVSCSTTAVPHPTNISKDNAVTPPTVPTPSQSTSRGIFSLNLTGNENSRVSALNATSEISGLSFSPIAFETITDTAKKTRYLQATFEVTNNSGQAITQPVFIPLLAEGKNGTVGETPFKSLARFDGQEVSDQAPRLSIDAPRKSNEMTGRIERDRSAAPMVIDLKTDGIQVALGEGTTVKRLENRGWRTRPLPVGGKAIVTFTAKLALSDQQENDPFSFNMLFTVVDYVGTPKQYRDPEEVLESADPGPELPNLPLPTAGLSAPNVEVVLEPAASMMTQPGETRIVRLRASEDGQQVSVGGQQVEWVSSDPVNFPVVALGPDSARVESKVKTGSAVVVARSVDGKILSKPHVIVAGEVAPDVQVVPDSQVLFPSVKYQVRDLAERDVVGPFTVADFETVHTEGNYTFVLKDTYYQVGDLLVSGGDAPIIGQVTKMISRDNHQLISVSRKPLSDMFGNLNFNLNSQELTNKGFLKRDIAEYNPENQTNSGTAGQLSAQSLRQQTPVVRDNCNFTWAINNKFDVANFKLTFEPVQNLYINIDDAGFHGAGLDYGFIFDTRTKVSGELKSGLSGEIKCEIKDSNKVTVMRGPGVFMFLTLDLEKKMSSSLSLSVPVMTTNGKLVTDGALYKKMIGVVRVDELLNVTTDVIDEKYAKEPEANITVENYQGSSAKWDLTVEPKANTQLGATFHLGVGNFRSLYPAFGKFIPAGATFPLFTLSAGPEVSAVYQSPVQVYKGKKSRNAAAFGFVANAKLEPSFLSDFVKAIKEGPVKLDAGKFLEVSAKASAPVSNQLYEPPRPKTKVLTVNGKEGWPNNTNVVKSGDSVGAKIFFVFNNNPFTIFDGYPAIDGLMRVFKNSQSVRGAERWFDQNKVTSLQTTEDSLIDSFTVTEELCDMWKSKSSVDYLVYNRFFVGIDAAQYAGEFKFTCDQDKDKDGNGRPDDEDDDGDDDNGGNGNGGSAGDPHLRTYDGENYSFQGIGEYVLSQSDDNQFEVQARFVKVNELASANAAVALNVAGDHIGIYPSNGEISAGITGVVVVNGQEMPYRSGQKDLTVSLPKGGALTLTGQQAIISWPDGSQVIVRFMSSRFLGSIDVLPSDQLQGKLRGLLGNFDGDYNNEYTTAGGVGIPQFIKDTVTGEQVRVLLTYDQLYREFGDSWRVTGDSTLFHYQPGESTDSFTNTSFPPATPKFDPTQWKTAEETCKAAGAVSSSAIRNCTYDALVTNNDTEFIRANVEADPARPELSVTTYTHVAAAGDQVRLQAHVKGRDMQPLVWESSAGTITPGSDGSAVLQLPDEVGTFRVLVKSGALSATTEVIVDVKDIAVAQIVPPYINESTFVSVRMARSLADAGFEVTANRGKIQLTEKGFYYTAPSTEGLEVVTVQPKGRPDLARILRFDVSKPVKPPYVPPRRIVGGAVAPAPGITPTPIGTPSPGTGGPTGPTNPGPTPLPNPSQPQPRVAISGTSRVAVVGSRLFFNAHLEGNISYKDLKWSASAGELKVNADNSVYLTLPSAAGTVTLTATVGDLVATASITGQTSGIVVAPEMNVQANATQAIPVSSTGGFQLGELEGEAQFGKLDFSYATPQYVAPLLSTLEPKVDTIKIWPKGRTDLAQLIRVEIPAPTAVLSLPDTLYVPLPFSFSVSTTGLPRGAQPVVTVSGGELTEGFGGAYRFKAAKEGPVTFSVTVPGYPDLKWSKVVEVRNAGVLQPAKAQYDVSGGEAVEIEILSTVPLTGLKADAQRGQVSVLAALDGKARLRYVAEKTRESVQDIVTVRLNGESVTVPVNVKASTFFLPLDEIAIGSDDQHVFAAEVTAGALPLQWSVSGGKLEVSGNQAIFTPPVSPTAQKYELTVTSGNETKTRTIDVAATSVNFIVDGSKEAPAQAMAGVPIVLRGAGLSEAQGRWKVIGGTLSAEQGREVTFTPSQGVTQATATYYAAEKPDVQASVAINVAPYQLVLRAPQTHSILAPLNIELSGLPRSLCSKVKTNLGQLDGCTIKYQPEQLGPVTFNVSVEGHPQLTSTATVNIKPAEIMLTQSALRGRPGEQITFTADVSTYPQAPELQWKTTVGTLKVEGNKAILTLPDNAYEATVTVTGDGQTRSAKVDIQLNTDSSGISTNISYRNFAVPSVPYTLKGTGLTDGRWKVSVGTLETSEGSEVRYIPPAQPQAVKVEYYSASQPWRAFTTDLAVKNLELSFDQPVYNVALNGTFRANFYGIPTDLCGMLRSNLGTVQVQNGTCFLQYKAAAVGEFPIEVTMADQPQIKATTVLKVAEQSLKIFSNGYDGNKVVAGRSVKLYVTTDGLAVKPNLKWSATGGTIEASADGLSAQYTAPEHGKEGKYTIVVEGDGYQASYDAEIIAPTLVLEPPKVVWPGAPFRPWVRHNTGLSDQALVWEATGGATVNGNRVTPPAQPGPFTVTARHPSYPDISSTLNLSAVEPASDFAAIETVAGARAVTELMNVPAEVCLVNGGYPNLTIGGEKAGSPYEYYERCVVSFTAPKEPGQYRLPVVFAAYPQRTFYLPVNVKSATLSIKASEGSKVHVGSWIKLEALQDGQYFSGNVVWSTTIGKVETDYDGEVRLIIPADAQLGQASVSAEIRDVPSSKVTIPVDVVMQAPKVSGSTSYDSQFPGKETVRIYAYNPALGYSIYRSNPYPLPLVWEPLDGEVIKTVGNTEILWSFPKTTGLHRIRVYPAGHPELATIHEHRVAPNLQITLDNPALKGGQLIDGEKILFKIQDLNSTTPEQLFDGDLRVEAYGTTRFTVQNLGNGRYSVGSPYVYNDVTLSQLSAYTTGGYYQSATLQLGAVWKPVQFEVLWNGTRVEPGEQVLVGETIEIGVLNQSAQSQEVHWSLTPEDESQVTKVPLNAKVQYKGSGNHSPFMYLDDPFQRRYPSVAFGLPYIRLLGQAERTSSARLTFMEPEPTFVLPGEVWNVEAVMPKYSPQNAGAYWSMIGSQDASHLFAARNQAQTTLEMPKQAGRYTLAFHIPNYESMSRTELVEVLPTGIALGDVGLVFDGAGSSQTRWLSPKFGSDEQRLYIYPDFKEWSFKAKPVGYNDEIVWEVEGGEVRKTAEDSYTVVFTGQPNQEAPSEVEVVLRGHLKSNPEVKREIKVSIVSYSGGGGI